MRYHNIVNNVIFYLQSIGKYGKAIIVWKGSSVIDHLMLFTYLFPYNIAALCEIEHLSYADSQANYLEGKH